jgi:hypothetical protein
LARDEIKLMKELNIRLQCMIADEIRDKGGARILICE